jgi:PAS domain S-box-containing protein
MTMLPWFSRGLRYARRSLQIRRDLGEAWGQGQSLSFLSVIHYGASQWGQASEASHDAMRLLRQTGDQWEVNTAAWHDALALYRLGRLTEAAEAARRVYLSASAIGDGASSGIGLSAWCRASGGRVEFRLITDELASGREDAHTTTELQLAAAINRRAAGDLDAAQEYLDRALATIRKAGLRQEYVAPVFPWRATVARERAERTSALNPRLRRARLRACAFEARRARRIAHFYRNNLPHALREAALIAALRGRHRTGVRLLRRSVGVAQRQGAAYELALSRLALAEVAAARSGSRLAVEEAQTELSVIEAGGSDAVLDLDTEPTISLFDRFATLLNVGRAITAATSYVALEAAIRDAALTLLRAERCHLIAVGQLAQERLTTQSGEDLFGMSRTLLARAVDEGAPVVALGQAADSNESLLLSGVRSAIAAPILVDGKPATMLYATHRQISELFGDEEVQLAAFIATLAGAAFEHLAGSETRFRSLALNSSDVITLVDRDGIVSYQSAAVSRVFASPPGSMLGRPVTEWLHPDDLLQFSAVLGSAGKADDTRIECRFRHADGSYRVAETTVTNLLDEPTVAALVLNTRDVTDRNRAEEQLRDKNLELEKAGRAKDMFLASMSHELRTPLNAIIGFTGTLLMELPGPLNAEQSRQLRTVQTSGKHLLAIINDLLDLAKIESGAVQLNLEDVDCGRVVRSVMTSLQPLADAKGLALSAIVPDGSVIVRSDARALGQILINLVNNAIKFTDDGSVTVRLERGPGATRISVSDTGPGLSREDLGRIFKAFERGLETSVRHREGTGLGLHICQKLAELIDVRIEVDTAPGEGSTFALTFGEETP